MTREDMKVLSVGKIANLCHVGRATVQRWVADDKIKSFKLPSGHTRVKAKDFLAFLNNYNMPVPEEFYGQLKKVLIVDDDSSVVQATQEMLSNIIGVNLKIEIANCGIQGCLKLGSFQPDILILDLKMPDVGGAEVANELYNSHSSVDTQVIVITGHADQNSVEQLKQIGVERILKKPFNADDLEREVKQCIEAV